MKNMFFIFFTLVTEDKDLEKNLCTFEIFNNEYQSFVSNMPKINKFDQSCLSHFENSLGLIFDNIHGN